MAIEVVPARVENVPEMGRICYEAFEDISTRHGFKTDFHSVEFATMIMGMLVQREDCYVVAAMEGGEVVGANGLLTADEVAGVGPVCVDVSEQGRGIGRALMDDVLRYARENDIEMVRLMQDSFNMGSLSLYASMGFDTVEPVAVMEPAAIPCEDGSVRPVTADDLDAVEELSRRIYRVNRRNELAGLMRGPLPPLLREQDGRAVGYYGLGMIGHGVFETEEDALVLVGEAASKAPAELRRTLCPITQGSLYRRFLAAGFRNVKGMNLMALGPYEPPDGVWLCSVGF